MKKIENIIHLDTYFISMSLNTDDNNINEPWSTVPSKINRTWSKSRTQELISKSRSGSPTEALKPEISMPESSIKSGVDTNSSPTYTAIYPPLRHESLPVSHSPLPPPIPTPMSNSPVNVPTMPVPIPLLPMHKSNDIWLDQLNMLTLQQNIIKINIDYIKEEMKFPLLVRGKSPKEKEDYIGHKLCNLIDACLDKITPDIVNSGKWVPTIRNYKILGMICEKMNLKEKNELLTMKDTIPDLVKEACRELYIHQQNKSTSSAIVPDVPAAPAVPAVPAVPTNVNIAPDTIATATTANAIIAPATTATTATTANTVSQSNYSNSITYTLEQRKDHKDALFNAQEEFSKTCIPSEDYINNLKEQIGPLANWEGDLFRLNISNDKIKNSIHEFSKKKFLEHEWFIKNKLIKPYSNIFGMKIRITHTDTTLIISGKK